MATIKKYEHPIVKYSELAAQRRGLIINRTIDLEKVIDWRISIYYCKDKASCDELAEMVISALTLRDKIRILIFVLKKYDPEIFKVHSSLKRHLEKIRDNRNKMAHSWLDATVTFVGNRHKFKPTISNFKSKGETDLYDEKRIKALENMIIKYTHVLTNW